jgi:hypothetical protein
MLKGLSFLEEQTHLEMESLMFKNLLVLVKKLVSVMIQINYFNKLIKAEMGRLMKESF